MQRILITGAAGFIGGQTLLRLKDHGLWAMAVDQRPMPDHLRNVADSTVTADFAAASSLGQLGSHHIDAVIHCAGSSLVAPSVSDPGLYYDNNFVRTKTLVDYIRNNQPGTRIVFSSSSSIYGQPEFNPCRESDPVMPLSPYGQSKAMVEWLFEAYHRAYAVDYVCFRYFNACGADHLGRHGQEPGATHLIPRLLAAARDGSAFTLNGVGFDTRDGTCVRDYTHVEDIADAHVRAIDRKVPAGIYNLGTGTAHSNREIVDLVAQVTGHAVSVIDGPARTGDPAESYADPDLWKRTAGWASRWTVADAIEHAQAWHWK
jgi:UDP-glucose-4-epimerase GalE